MKERPILMSGPMVRALLEGRKTQTRRICKDQGDIGFLYVNDAQPFPEFWNGEKGESYTGWAVKYPELSIWLPRSCPHGQPGDQLWVRETFAENIPGCPNGLTYRADHQDPAGDGPANPIRWRPSIHMPRWASRITLEITGIQAEPLWRMTVDHMLAEGVPEAPDDDDHEQRHPLTPFIELWDSIYAQRGYPFRDNPWVWVITFRRIESKSK